MELSRRDWFVLFGVFSASAAGFLASAPPPGPPPMTHVEREILQRRSDLLVDRVRQWQQTHGDLTLPWSQAEGHLAIIIDDLGRELHLFDQLLGLRFQLSFSVLPGSVYAAGVQLRALSDRRRYREVLLHLPTEPLDAQLMFEGDERTEVFLRGTDGPQDLHRKVRDALAAVPAAAGVNNHMGSRLTADPLAMAHIMEVLAAAGVYFVDSRTTADSEALTAARAAGLLAGSRQVFLDNDLDRAAILEQLRVAAELSRRGPVVAIAHPSRETIDVLRTELPRLYERGIAIYPASQVVAAQE